MRQAVCHHSSDFHAKRLKTWNHLVAMIFSQLSDSQSLRELEVQYNAKSSLHYHLGGGHLKRSTLSDANNKRDSNVFRDILTSLISTQKKDIKDFVRILDSSIIGVDGRHSQWTESTSTRHGKGLKMHVSCDVSGEQLYKVEVTPTNVNDISCWRLWDLESEKLYLFDKGYRDYNWWQKIDDEGSHFITRIKTNAAYSVEKALPISSSDKHVKQDLLIQLKNKSPGGKRKNHLTGKTWRLVEYHDVAHDKLYRFITNLMDVPPTEIADYYKKRWRIEQLLQWIKQNLKIKTFIGESENAIKRQIYTALIAYILMHQFKKLAQTALVKAVDIMTWVKISILSHDITIPPPRQKINRNALKQLNLGRI